MNMDFDYDRERRLFELSDAQTGDIRFRGYVARALREQRDDGRANGARRRIQLESALAAVNRRITRRALVLADLEYARAARSVTPAA